MQYWIRDTYWASKINHIPLLSLMELMSLYLVILRNGASNALLKELEVHLACNTMLGMQTTFNKRSSFPFVLFPFETAFPFNLSAPHPRTGSHSSEPTKTMITGMPRLCLAHYPLGQSGFFLEVQSNMLYTATKWQFVLERVNKKHEQWSRDKLNLNFGFSVHSLYILIKFLSFSFYICKMDYNDLMCSVAVTN